jgi:hypothetical protein
MPLRGALDAGTSAPTAHARRLGKEDDAMNEWTVTRLAALAGQVRAWRDFELEVVISDSQSYVYATVQGDDGRIVLDTEGDIPALERALLAMSEHPLSPDSVLKQVNTAISQFGFDPETTCKLIKEAIGEADHALQVFRQRDGLRLVRPG